MLLLPVTIILEQDSLFKRTMKKIIFALVFITSFSCMAQKETKKWLGYTDVDKLSTKFEWFSQSYVTYKPDPDYIKKLSALAPDYTFLVFGGIWCGDTKELLPQFYKTIDQAGISRDKVKLYLLDEKKISPEKLEVQYKITRIPVFILLKDGKEVGRITEETQKSIESDLAGLIK